MFIPFLEELPEPVFEQGKRPSSLPHPSPLDPFLSIPYPDPPVDFECGVFVHGRAIIIITCNWGKFSPSTSYLSLIVSVNKALLYPANCSVVVGKIFLLWSSNQMPAFRITYFPIVAMKDANCTCLPVSWGRFWICKSWGIRNFDRVTRMGSHFQHDCLIGNWKSLKQLEWLKCFSGNNC